MSLRYSLLAGAACALLLGPPASARADDDCRTHAGPFAWSCAGPLDGMTCTAVNEPSDPDTWHDNYLCASSDLGLRWSYSGPIAGMRCTQITEPSEPQAHTWNDNYLCVPQDSSYQLSWSYRGPVPRLQPNCLRVTEPSDHHDWHDNYLCWSGPAPQLQIARDPAPKAPPRKLPPNTPPDAPLEFRWGAPMGPGQVPVWSSPRWTVLLEFYRELQLEMSGAVHRKIYRQAAGSEPVVIWDRSTFAGNPAPEGPPPRVWYALDDGTVIFSIGPELNAVREPGAPPRTQQLRIGEEDFVPLYLDPSGVVLRPNEWSRLREAYFVPGADGLYDLARRVRITGPQGMAPQEPIFKRRGDRLVWLEWVSADQPNSTSYRLSMADVKTGPRWSHDITIKGTARLESFDSRTVQVSGQRYDAASGKRL